MTLTQLIQLIQTPNVKLTNQLLAHRLWWSLGTCHGMVLCSFHGIRRLQRDVQHFQKTTSFTSSTRSTSSTSSIPTSWRSAWFHGRTTSKAFWLWTTWRHILEAKFGISLVDLVETTQSEKCGFLKTKCPQVAVTSWRCRQILPLCTFSDTGLTDYRLQQRQCM